MNCDLIVNADDFGISEGVSRGIIEAHLQGIVSSTTFMVNFSWATEMVPLLQKAPNLGVGIHLNLTTGTPLLAPEQVPSLVDRQGRFSKSLWHLLFGVDRQEALREWSAQVEKGMTLLGRTPTHLDTHHYLQVYPGYQEVMIEVARRYQIPVIRCLHPGRDLDKAGMLPGWLPGDFVIDSLVSHAKKAVTRSGLPHPRTTVATAWNQQRLLDTLERLPTGTVELVCHPGRIDDGLRSLSSLREQRETELGALTSLAVRERLTTRQIRLISFAGVMA